MSYPFLSPDWIVAVRGIREEFAEQAEAQDLEHPGVDVKANVTVVDAPFDEPTVKGHLNTSSGAIALEEDHLADADFSIEMPYSVAYQIFVDRDPQAMLSILVSGQVKLSGDSSKLLGLAGLATAADGDTPGADLAVQIVRRIDAITLTD